MNHASTRAADRPIKVIRPTQSAIEILCTGFMSLLSRKSLFVEMALLRLRVRYKQSLLGWAWAILPPLVLMITYTVVFYKVAGFTTADLPVPVALFIFAGLIPWTFLSTSISTATAGIVANRYLIVRASFPREIIPLSYVAAAFVDLGVGSVMLIAMMYWFGFAPNLHILYAIPVIGMLGMYGAAVSLCFASFQARFRDIGVAMPLLLQVAMFATPVVYSSAAIPQSVAHIYFLNPLAILVDQFRQAVVQGINPNVGDMLYCAIIAVVCLVFSYILFKRLDATLADVI